MFSKAYYIPNQMCLENTSKDAVYLMFILKTQGAIGQSDRLSLPLLHRTVSNNASATLCTDMLPSYPAPLELRCFTAVTC